MVINHYAYIFIRTEKQKVLQQLFFINSKQVKDDLLVLSTIDISYDIYCSWSK